MFSTARERRDGKAERRGGAAEGGGATPVDSPIVFLSDRWFVHLDMVSTLRRYRRKTEAEVKGRARWCAADAMM